MVRAIYSAWCINAEKIYIPDQFMMLPGGVIVDIVIPDFRQLTLNTCDESSIMSVQ
jgi:hypothetical protein